MYRTCILFTVALLLALASSAFGQLGPDGWWSETIAVSSDPPGSATIDGGTYTITGDGHDIWDAADDFHYLYKELVGDGSMTCRVVSIGTGSNTWAKGGVMIRDNNTRGSADAYCVMTSNSDGAAGNGAGFQWRDSQGAGAAWDGAGPSQVVAPPYWVRLERQGNVFRGYLSPDGTTWTQLQNDHTVVMTDPVLIGLCVTSHAAGELRTFVFDNVSWTGDVRDRPPQLKAWNPDPPDGTEGWSTPLFQWTKGETGYLNNVYFGEDPENLPQVWANQAHDFYYHAGMLEPSVTYYWRVDQVEVDMTTIHTGDVWSFTVTPTGAWNPSPADEAEGVFPAVTLTWGAGQRALQQQLYFGADRAAVEAGDASVDQGVLDETTWTAPILRSSSTYYWRVDQIQMGGTVVEGDLWSFTTDAGSTGAIMRQWWEDIGGDPLSALINSPDYPNNPSGSELVDLFEGPVDWADNYGSRLYGWLRPPESGDYTFWIAGDNNSELWLSTDEDPANAVVIASVAGWTPSRDFDNTGGGAGDAATQESDPVTLQGGQKYFIQALQKEGSGGDNIALAWQGGPIAARAVISAEYVDTFALPPLTAFSPSPADGAVDTGHSPILTWAAGENATQHDVYFGDDEAAVAAADTTTAGIYRGRQTGTGYSPGELDWNKTYYWRIDEIEADGTIRPGKVWVFTTADFIPIDSFETYTNEVGNRLFQFWVDGLGYTEPPPGNPGNGSTAWVGHDIWTAGTPYTTIVETGTVQDGAQAMPLYYNNSGAPHYAQADHALAPAVDMASNGLTDLSLWVYGAPVKFEQTGPDSVTMSGGGADIQGTADEFRFAYKSLSGNGSITAKLETIEQTHVWAKGGVMIRASLDAGALRAYMVGTPGGWAEFGSRLFNGDVTNAASDSPVELPTWVRLTRTGNTFEGEYSTDGVIWQNVTDGNGNPVSADITMTGTVYIGLCLTSHNSNALTVADFSEIATTGATGQWQVADIGVAQAGNAPDDLYLGLSSGGALSVVSVGSAPVLTADWVNVKVPLADFAGVNLGAVTQISVGVGNPTAPVMTGDGLVIIDNVRVVKPEPEPAVEQ